MTGFLTGGVGLVVVAVLVAGVTLAAGVFVVLVVAALVAGVVVEVEIVVVVVAGFTSSITGVTSVDGSGIGFESNPET